jgi:hypothetical protein
VRSGRPDGEGGENGLRKECANRRNGKREAGDGRSRNPRDAALTERGIPRVPSFHAATSYQLLPQRPARPPSPQPPFRLPLPSSLLPPVTARPESNTSTLPRRRSDRRS